MSFSLLKTRKGAAWCAAPAGRGEHAVMVSQDWRATLAGTILVQPGAVFLAVR
jgi:hypothetical protein